MNDYFRYVGGTVGAAALTGAAAATAIYRAWSPSPVSPPVDINNQTSEIPDSGGARQSRLAPPGGVTGFLYDDAKTLYEMMQRGQRLSSNGPCLGYKVSKNEYGWISYGDVIERSRNIAFGFVKIGMKPGQSSFIGIYSQNCVEWILTEQACYNQSAVNVPLYDTLGPNACTFIINQAEIEIVVCDTVEKAVYLLDKKKETPSLKHIIIVKAFDDQVRELAKEKGVHISSLKEIEDLGKVNAVPVKPPQPSDMASICYTSGTTGDPKGVMLTHSNIIICASAINKHLDKLAPKVSDVLISFLPLAHMMQRITEIILYIGGGRVGFYGGDIRTLSDDLRALKPTIILAVPRVLNKIYDKVIAQTNRSLMKRKILNLALKMKQSELRRLIIRSNSIWDRIVFHPVREGMGGEVRLVVSGSAPLADNVLSFIRCALGCVVVEGYGQTECVAPGALSVEGDFTVGHVGVPIPCNHFKLIDVPEMQYFSKDGKGEICIKGPNVFMGYFKDPKKTSETVDSEGWLHTGDIGMWNPNGSLKIVDRKKHIFKLAQGEYIAPEKIENIYLSSQYVGQIFVHGESLQSCLVAVVVPDKEVLQVWCKANGIVGGWEGSCRNKDMKSLILTDITKLGKNLGLKSFEQVKDIYVHPEMFSVDNGLLTPTMKTKRSECKKCFSDVIENMYRELSALECPLRIH